MRTRLALFSLALALLSGGALADARVVGPAVLQEAPLSVAAPAPPLRLAEALLDSPANQLRPSQEVAIEELEALESWNRSGRRPLRNGFSRPLPQPGVVILDRELLASSPLSEYAGGVAARSLNGNLVWGTAIQAESAQRLRLKLSNVVLPSGTRLWVYGLGDDRPVPFGLELIDPDGVLWTPTVASDWLHLEVEIPKEALLPPGKRYGFAYDEVIELVNLGSDGSPIYHGLPPEQIGECLIDATCIDSSVLDVVSQYRQAVAHLQYVKNGLSFLCSGALINDTDNATFIPYLLTANHCFATQASASSLEAYWHYRTSSCFGTFPPLPGLPRSLGSTLLATGAGSDFTFVRLNGLPAGQSFYLLGWNSNPGAVSGGTVLHRISHPVPAGAPFPQSYSRSVVTATSPTCPSWPRPNFLYAQGTDGAPFGGSSGAPVILPGGFVVGQLSGGCGPDPADGCNYANLQVDGALSATFPHISQWLTPVVTTDPCIPSDTTLCVDDQPGDRRFKVTMHYNNAQSSGFGHAIPLSSLGVNRGGLFWIGNPTNPEMLIKILNACVPPFNAYWVFYAATTNQGLETVVTDTQTGRTWSRTNPRGTAAPPVQDTGAFPCD